MPEHIYISYSLVDPEGQHAHVLVPPDQLSLAIGREGQNVRLAARLTGWKIDIKNSQEYDQATEDSEVAELIAHREEEEALQREAEARLAAEHAPGVPRPPLPGVWHRPLRRAAQAAAEAQGARGSEAAAGAR